MSSLHHQLLELGITDAHRHANKLPAHQECQNLIAAGVDIYTRPQSMAPSTLLNWLEMKEAAEIECVNLGLVSAFRSIDYQYNLIKQKLAAGRRIEDILKVNALPGYSEHHTGRALDLCTSNSEPLEEIFDTTLAFQWLQKNAEKHHFYLSYPKDNNQGLCYEPWHWTCRIVD